MAAIARRSLAQIRAEVILRCGNITASGFSGRVEYWLWEAYLDLATEFHHFELDKIDSSIVLSTSTNEISLPADCFVVVGLRLKNTAGTAIVGEVGKYNFDSLSLEYRATPGLPTRWARFGPKLYFDLKPDAAYTSDLFYYRLPTAPDFAGSATSELGVDCDTHLIELATALASGGTKDQIYAAVNRESFAAWAASQVRSSIQSPVFESREATTTNSTLGGAQG